MKDLFIYCAGGFGKEVMDVARRTNNITKQWECISFIDDSSSEKSKYGAQVYQLDELVSLNKLTKAEVLIANGEPAVRKKLHERLVLSGGNLGVLVDPSSIISDSALIECGVVITPFCSVSSNAFLCRNSSVNTMSIIGHDVKVGENSVISSMVNIGGATVIGDNCYIGMGALIKEGISIGSGSIVGMGSVVYSDIPANMIALGNPARVVRKNTEQRVFK
ncbi:acetyltransferase [beta proteobacterium MWH-UniP1]